MENHVLLSFCVHQDKRMKTVITLVWDCVFTAQGGLQSLGVIIICVMVWTKQRLGIRFVTLEDTFRYMMQKSGVVLTEII